MEKKKLIKIISRVVLAGLLCFTLAFSSVEVVAGKGYGPTPTPAPTKEERKEAIEKERVVQEQSWDELKQHAASYPEDSVSPSVNSFIQYILSGTTQRNNVMNSYQAEQEKLMQQQQAEQMYLYGEITEQQRLMMEEMMKQQELLRKQLLNMQ